MEFSEKDIQENVRRVVKEALCVEDDEVTLDARLTDDLGAESIDYLDIVFRLEKTFDIKIDRDELMFGNSSSEDYFKDDRITDAGLEEIRRRFPDAAVDAVEKSRSVADFVRVFTVAALVTFVKEKLATREAE
ncbi:MAG TPA: acyl carrier protein [Planctomycetaceae bacterium]|nr:acyl carrier protein [Planctomycetaceae bacterium]